VSHRERLKSPALHVIPQLYRRDVFKNFCPCFRLLTRERTATKSASSSQNLSSSRISVKSKTPLAHEHQARKLTLLELMIEHLLKPTAFVSQGRPPFGTSRASERAIFKSQVKLSQPRFIGRDEDHGRTNLDSTTMRSMSIPFQMNRRVILGVDLRFRLIQPFDRWLEEWDAARSSYIMPARKSGLFAFRESGIMNRIPRY
jgi:hypothetical protein